MFVFEADSNSANAKTSNSSSARFLEFTLRTRAAVVSSFSSSPFRRANLPSHRWKYQDLNCRIFDLDLCRMAGGPR